MKNYTEEEVQEIVLKSLFSGWNMTAQNYNAEIDYAAECLCDETSIAFNYQIRDHFRTTANAILKELNVAEIK